MKKTFEIICFCLFLFEIAHAQYTGIGTNTPQSALDVNGTFRLGSGDIVNGISADSLMLPGSDSLLPTQSAIRRYLKTGKWVRNEGEIDSVYQVTSQTPDMPSVRKIVEQNGMAYVLTNSGLWIYDVSDPDTIIQRDSSSALFAPIVAGHDMDMEVQGNFVYICLYAVGKFGVYDVSNPDHIVLRSSKGLYAFRSMVVDGPFAYLVTYNFSTTYIMVFNISNPDTVVTKMVYSNNLINGATIIEKTGKWLWVVSPFSAYIPGSSDFLRLNTSDPDTLILVTNNVLDGSTVATTTTGNRIYFAQGLASGSYLMLFQVNQSTIQMMSSPPISIPLPAAIDAKGNEMYLTVQGAYNNTGNYATTINFDISTIHPKPTWVFERRVNCLFALSHNRFLAGDSKLYSISLFPQQDKRDLIRHTDGSMAYEISPWYTDTLFNVTADNGYIGIGTDQPEVKLHLVGDQRIDGNHTIEFGADIAGKEINAGKIGYGTFSGDALDIVGGGAVSNRRIDLYGEDGVNFTGKLNVEAHAFHFAPVVAENGLRFSQHVGIGTAPTPDQALLVYDGMNIFDHGATPGGIWINRPGNVSAQANFIGDRGDQVGGIRTASGWNLLQSGANNFGIGMEPGTDKLSVAGSCKTGTMFVNNNAWLHNGVRLAGNNTIKVGAVTNYNASIEYHPNSLDFIVYTFGYEDIIRLKAEGGTTIDGPVNVPDTLTVGTISTDGWTDLTGSLQNGWVNYGGGYVTISMSKDRTGIVHLRGLIKDGLNQQNTVIVNLPAGYRPVNGHQIYAVTNGVNTAGRIDVETDGDVVFRGSTNTFLCLDQISFKTN